MKLNILKLLLLLIVIQFNLTINLLGKDTTSVVSEDKMVLNQNFFGIQLELTSMIFIYEYGGHLDYDIFKSKNGFYNTGTRLSYEKYYAGTVGGSIHGSPFSNYNLFIRHSFRGSIFWFDLLAGISYYTTSASEFYPDDILLRAGFELSLHFSHDVIGLTLKSSTSFKKNTGYLGLGLTIGFYNN